MNLNEYIELVSTLKSDIEPVIESLTEKVLINDTFRQLVTDQLISHNHIMVYYHSFLIIDRASKREPILFYASWDRFVSLLESSNSYHRNYAMQILANLTRVDEMGRFEKTIDKYFNQLNDDKFLTRRYCVLNTRVIIINKTQLSDTIIQRLISFLKTSDNTEKQQNLILSDFINVVLDIAPFIKNKNDLLDFLFILEKEVKSAKLKRQLLKVIPLIKTAINLDGR